jgi:hypothetical protein
MNMGLFDTKNRDLFYPNCRPIQGSSEGRVVLECQPKLMRDGKVLTGERPVQIILEAGQKAFIADDGGNPTDVLEMLTSHIEGKRLQ